MAELKDKNIHDIMHFRDANGLRLSPEECGIVKAIKTGRPYVSSNEIFVRKDGTAFPVHVISSPIREEDNIVAAVAAFRDITEQKRAEEELEAIVLDRSAELKKAHDRLRSLAAHLQSVREEERKRIAREIHDELGQALAAQKMDLGLLRDKYGDHKFIVDKTSAMSDALNSTIQWVRRICTELRPSILDHLGLIDAMEWQANEFQARTHIECTVLSSEEIRLNNELNTVLFRIFQEALTNVLKHAKATQVLAQVARDGGNVILEVVDNGIGIEKEHLLKPNSFGLMGMRERVYPWGGEVKISGHKNAGTTVKVILPLSDKSPATMSTSEC